MKLPSYFPPSINIEAFNGLITVILMLVSVVKSVEGVII